MFKSINLSFIKYFDMWSAIAYKNNDNKKLHLQDINKCCLYNFYIIKYSETREVFCVCEIILFLKISVEVILININSHSTLT